MSNFARDNRVCSVAPLSKTKDALHVTGQKAASGAEVIDVMTDRGFAKWSTAEYKPRYTDTSDVPRFNAVFLDGVKLFAFVH